jgi:alkaline phosphatase D
MVDPHALDRREFLGAAGAGAGALILGGVPVDPALAGRARRRATPIARGGSFPQGIASGIPTHRGVTLWTRLNGFDRDRLLHVEVARDADFRNVVLRRKVRARAREDHTVETRVFGRAIRPGRQYYYRFETRDRSSEVGRFRLAPPPDSREPVRIAFFSCQDWEAGYFPAHAAIADEDVDLAVCLGDYIYERHYYDGPRRDTLGANRDGEVQTLPEYRDKYKLYKTDPNLRAMHAAHPFAAIWDDHEVEDNFAGTHPGEATGQVRVPFLQRRTNGFRAFYEYMPFSRDHHSRDLYRLMRLGRTADLFLLDQRQYRDDQPCGDSLTAISCPEAEGTPRTYLGERQLAWLKGSLDSSRATWKLVASQLMAMSIDALPGNPINKDSWDGYGVERRDLLGHVQSRGIRNLSFLVGDIHTFFAGDVGVNGRGPGSVATEFVSGAITSQGIPEQIGKLLGVPKELAGPVITQVLNLNPHIKYEELNSKGYGVLEASSDELNVEFKAVDQLRRDSRPRTIARFRVDAGSPHVRVL